MLSIDKHSHRYKSILMFCLLYVNESIMFRETFSATVRIIITMIIFAAWILYLNGNKAFEKLGIKRNCLYLALVLYVCMVFSWIVNGFYATFDVWVIYVIAFAVLFVSQISYDEFKEAYTDVMAFLGGASVVLFLGYKIVPGLYSIFPDNYWHSGMLIKNCFLCAIPAQAQYYRNFGIFNEPGHYSVFLVWALIISLFATKVNVKKVLILIIALATTLSTNGILCLVVLIAAFLINRTDISKKVKRRLGAGILIVVIAFVVFMVLNPQSLSFLLDKFTEISLTDTVDDSTGGSGYQRFRAVVYAWECFLENPVVGVAYTGWSEKFDSVIGTATVINWFGLYGFVFGIVMNFLYFRMVFKMQVESVRRLIVNILLVVVMGMNIMSQNMVSDIILMILVMYQVTADARRSQIVNYFDEETLNEDVSAEQLDG